MSISKIRNFVNSEEGLETIEYTVMTSLIVAALLLSVVVLSAAVTGTIGDTAVTIGTGN